MALLTGKTIVITGGSLGIGLAISKKCVKEEARVIIVARNSNNLNNAIKLLAPLSIENNLSYSLDVSDYNSVMAFSNWCLDNKLKINGLVNCAGIYGPIGNSRIIDMAAFETAIRINFLGTVFMSSVFSRILKNNERTKIVNFSGGGAATPFPNYSAYATSKVAIVRFTENFALELQNEMIDINCVAPGFVLTRLHEQTISQGVETVGREFYDSTLKQIESGGVSPDIAADLSVFLLSGESDGISGKFISAPWDPWKEKEFQEKLRKDKDLATLRRIDNKTFFKKI